MDDKEKQGEYEEEARRRWGHTEAYEQSTERVAKMGKEGLAKVLEESTKLTNAIADCMKWGDAASSEPVQKLIASHYGGLRAFYEPNLEMYRGLANMYVDDPRFKAHYDKVAPGLAEFMKEAMLAYVDSQVR